MGGTDHARQTRSTMIWDWILLLPLDGIGSDGFFEQPEPCHRHSSAKPWLPPNEASRELGPGAGAVRAISRAGFALPLRAWGSPRGRELGLGPERGARGIIGTRFDRNPFISGVPPRGSVHVLQDKIRSSQGHWGCLVKKFGFGYCSTFRFIWQFVSNHGLIRLKRFVSWFITKLCN
jgi:hypothetical protein